MEPERLRLGGLDGNAFNLLGAFRAATRRQGRTDPEIQAVCDEATAGDYSHLIATLMKYTEDPSEGDEDNG